MYTIFAILTKPFRHMRLRNKLFALVGLVSLGPILLFGAYSYETMRRELTRQMYDSMAGTTGQVSANLKMKLDSYSKISSSLYLDRRLQTMLTNDYSSGSGYLEAYDYINNTFNNLLATNSDIADVVVYSTNPTLPADQVFIRRADEKMKQNAWYRAVEKAYGSVTFTVMRATNPTNEAVAQGTEERKPNRIVLARQLDNNSLNYPYGILTLDIPEADIYALMEKENVSKAVFVVAADGTIISGKDKSLLNENLYAQLHGEQSDGLTGSYFGTYNGERVYVVYNTIDNGWRTVSVVSYDSLLSNVNRAFSRIAVIGLATALVAIGLIYIMARLFTKRIEKLLQVTRRIEREDFDIQLPDNSHDELGQLSFAMTKMSGRMKALINEVYKKEIAKKEAEMNMLQAQINPHFLYNTLASISALAARSQDTRIQDMVGHLAKFYRISLNKGKRIISFGEELRLTKSYIAIQQLRFQGLLHIHERIDEAALPYPVVKLMLQPFIENVINHAIWDDEAGINIILKAQIEGDILLLHVIDDGMGMRPEKLALLQPEWDGESTSGYGIRNVDARIKLAFGEEYGVRIYSRFGIGTSVQIRIPLSGLKE
nr:sensor histidine kinase [Paenibacillus phyllosphaerae]